MFFLNIKIERKIPKSDKSCLLNVTKIGEEKRDAFAYECQKNPERLEKNFKSTTIYKEK